jgi:large subunit ribosomal protein L24
MKYNKGTSRKNREKHSKARRVTVAARPIKMKVKRGDTVKVISGKDKGKQGEVVKVMPRENKIVVDGIAIAKRHLRHTSRGQSGRIVERAMPINASNVAVVAGKKKDAKN